MAGRFSGERPGRGWLFSYDEARHLAAYCHARELTCGKRVLDIGCGEGFGTSLLAETASFVLGVDYSAAAIARARKEFSRPDLEFRRLEAVELASLGSRFGLVCSFQLLEHLRDPLPFLQAVMEVLEPGGTFLLTTPNEASSVSENPYHVREYTAGELRALLEPVFRQVEVYGIMGNRKVAEYDRRRAREVKRILRLDPVGLRHLLPAAVVQWLFGRLAVVVRRRLRDLEEGPRSVFTPDDFFADRACSSGALDLVARCSR